MATKAGTLSNHIIHDDILLDELIVATNKLDKATRAEDIKAINRVVKQLLKEFIEKNIKSAK